MTETRPDALQIAGPIHSHRLMLRSLGLMRDLSPDDLNRFTGCVDTVLILANSGRIKPATKYPQVKGQRTD
uniref:DUF2894 domain-containing protein n=1 Tax=Limnohabitans sp. TaxID=1907725 RepID=UPI004047C9A1